MSAAVETAEARTQKLEGLGTKRKRVEDARFTQGKGNYVDDIKLTVNGRAAEALAEPRMLLIHFLREELRLTGPHIGCDTSHCGACTVDFNGKSVKSCTMFVAQANGGAVTTIEGMAAADGTLHPLQEAFREHHGLQCGFCTPGMITRAWRLLQENPDPTEAEIRAGIAGNLCRCTGYQNIVKAIRAAAERMSTAKEAAE